MLNKLLILLPAALLLGAFAPWAVTPLLLLGGLYLAYEGTEKVFEAFAPHQAHTHEAALGTVAPNAKTLEDERVAGAIKTDFILSAEIMAITLSGLTTSSVWTQAAVMAVVAIGITIAVYGAVALIVKADDAGLALAKSDMGATAAFGRGIVRAMPTFLKGLAVLGTAAMLWVGGGIIVHSLAGCGLEGPERLIHDIAVAVGLSVSAAGGIAEWVVTAIGSGIVGLVAGFASIPIVGKVVAPLWKAVTGLRSLAEKPA